MVCALAPSSRSLTVNTFTPVKVLAGRFHRRFDRRTELNHQPAGKRHGNKAIMQAHMALANKHSTAQRNKAIKHTSSTGVVTQAKSPHVLQGNNPTKRFSEEVCNIAFTTHAKHEDLLLLELVLDETFALTRWAPRESLANPWMASLVPPQGNYEEKLYVFTQECPRGANALWHERKKKRLRSRLNY